MSVFTEIRRDSENERLIIQRLDETGAPITSGGDYKGAIELSLQGSGSGTDLGCLGSDGNWHRIYLQETEICVSGVVKKCLVLRSDPY